MKNIGIGLICLIVVALFGLSLYQHQLLKKLSPVENNGEASNRFAAENTPDTEAEATAAWQASASAVTDSGDVDMLEAQLDATENKLDNAYQQLDDEMARKEALEEKQLELQRQYMESPAFRNNMRSYLSSQYKDLLEEMNLSDEKQAEFLDMLIDQQTALMELSPEIQTATTDAQKEDLRQRYADIKEADETALKDLLGTDYETYHDYAEMRTTRYFIDGFSASLDSDDQLTEDQEKKLTEIMYKEQMQAFAEMGYDPRNELEFPSDVEEGAVNGEANNMAIIHSRSLEKSQGLLSGSQFEQYKKYLNNLQEMAELQSQLSN